MFTLILSANIREHMSNLLALKLFAQNKSKALQELNLFYAVNQYTLELQTASQCIFLYPFTKCSHPPEPRLECSTQLMQRKFTAE